MFNKSILLLTYNRLEYTKQVFESIRNIKPKKLYIASDGPRLNKENDKEKIELVRNYLINNIDWDCRVYKRFLDINSGGCAYGVSSAVTWFFQNEEDGIILEDDCVPNQFFYYFCEVLLDRYKYNKEIFVIDGYSAFDDINIKESYYFTNFPQIWGWATWANRWNNYFSLNLTNYDENIVNNLSKNKIIQKFFKNKLVIFQKQWKDNKMGSWAYPWAFNIVKQNGLVITPKKNLVTNIGLIGDNFNGEKNFNLFRKTYELNDIIHPKSITLFSQKIVDKIFKYCFNINNRYPKLFIKFICLFILNKKKRKEFRRKYML